MLYYIAVPLVWLYSHLLFRIKVIGKENLPKQGGFILAPNHISGYDPVIILPVSRWLPKLVTFAKRDLFEIHPLLTWLFKQLGGVAVRGGGKEEMGALDDAIKGCKDGRGLLIFPEGTRSKDGKIGAIKSGAFVVASAAGVGMVPCRIIYDTPDGRCKFFCRVRVVYGEMIPAEQFAMGEKRDMKKLRAAKQLLAQSWEELYQRNKFAERGTD